MLPLFCVLAPLVVWFYFDGKYLMLLSFLCIVRPYLFGAETESNALFSGFDPTLTFGNIISSGRLDCGINVRASQTEVKCHRKLSAFHSFRCDAPWSLPFVHLLM